jgi:hypothetical protein
MLDIHTQKGIVNLISANANTLVELIDVPIVALPNLPNLPRLQRLITICIARQEHNEPALNWDHCSSLPASTQNQNCAACFEIAVQRCPALQSLHLRDESSNQVNWIPFNALDIASYPPGRLARFTSIDSRIIKIPNNAAGSIVDASRYLLNGPMPYLEEYCSHELSLVDVAAVIREFATAPEKLQSLLTSAFLHPSDQYILFKLMCSMDSGTRRQLLEATQTDTRWFDFIFGDGAIVNVDECMNFLLTHEALLNDANRVARILRRSVLSPLSWDLLPEHFDALLARHRARHLAKLDGEINHDYTPNELSGITIVSSQAKGTLY